MIYKAKDWTNFDFRVLDLSGQNISHSVIAGAKFGKCAKANFVCCRYDPSASQYPSPNFIGADISDTTFEKADSSVVMSLVGALWHGTVITRIYPPKVYGSLWWFATNAFIQIGCKQHSWADIKDMSLGPESVSAALPDLTPEMVCMSWGWWQQNGVKLLSQFENG